MCIRRWRLLSVKTEGTEFFNWSSSEILKIPKSTWNVKALKIVVLGLHKGEAVREPIKLVMKLNLWNVRRKYGTQCGAEGTAAEVSSRKSKWALGRHERNIVHLYGVVQPYPFCDSVPRLPQESTGKCCVQQTDPNPVRPSPVFHISSAKNVCQKSICNCFHSCVFIMGSLIILHVVYEAILVIFRFGLSMLTSVLQWYIHHHSVASEFHLGRVLPKWALWRCKTSPQQPQ